VENDDENENEDDDDNKDEDDKLVKPSSLLSLPPSSSNP
jgi:hypothetical protein